MRQILCLASGICLLVALATSCEKTTTGASYERRLTIVKPSDQSVKRGESNQITIKIERQNSRDPVKITFSPLPAGVLVTDQDKIIAAEETSGTFTLRAEPQAGIVTNHRVDVLAKVAPDLEARQWFNLTVKD